MQLHAFILQQLILGLLRTPCINDTSPRRCTCMPTWSFNGQHFNGCMLDHSAAPWCFGTAGCDLQGMVGGYDRAHGLSWMLCQADQTGFYLQRPYVHNNGVGWLVGWLAIFSPALLASLDTPGCLLIFELNVVCALTIWRTPLAPHLQPAGRLHQVCARVAQYPLALRRNSHPVQPCSRQSSADS